LDAEAAMNEFLGTLIRLTGSALSSRVTVGDVVNVLFALSLLALVALVLLVHAGIESRRSREALRGHATREAHHGWLRHRH
jgi:nitrate/nitrite transporter NarK